VAPHFGRKVVGDEAFDRAIREEKGGGSVFGTRVRDAIPDNNTMNSAKRATEMGVRVVNEVTPQDHRGETKDGGSISIEDLRNILAENPTFFDSLYEGELAREDGPRDDALRIFQEIERGIKGAGRESVLSEIRALLGETAITAGQKADLAQAHREQMLRQLKRQDENNQLIDADRVQALRDRAEALDAIKASDSEGSKDQIISADVDNQTAHIGRELGLDIPGTGTGKPTPGSVPTKPDGDVHPGTQQPGSRANVPKSGPGADSDTAGGSGASKGSEGGEVDYETQTKAELQEEADRRDLDVKGTGADGAVLKDDLVKALKKSDKRGK
jgi:hypothetical protein